MYEKPTVRELGTFAGLTLDTINKVDGGTDTVVYSPSGNSITIPGHGASIS